MTTRMSHRRLSAASTAILLAVFGVPLGATPASAAIAEPPVGGHDITVFTERDMVGAAGYTPGQLLMVQVVRSGVLIGQSDATASPLGDVEINHGGGDCWNLPSTPDIRRGDLVRVLTGPDDGDQTTTADISITQPGTDAGGGTVTVRGTAVGVGGVGRLPEAELAVRIVGNGELFPNGRPRLDAPGDGIVAYDADTGSAWTATFGGLTADQVTSAATGDNVVRWLGTGAAGTELTQWEFGELGGPAVGCPAPAAKGPSVPDLTTDSGASATDNITNVISPTFTGVRGLETATAVTLIVDGVADATTLVSAATPTYSLIPTSPLAHGTHTITASETSPGSTPGSTIETEAVGSLSVTIDTDPALPPSVTSTVPGSPGMSSAPLVKGTADAGSTVRLYTNSTCSGIAVSGSAATFGSTGISVPLALNATTSVFGTAVDLAGNAPSGCSSTSVSFTHDSVAPPVPVITTAPSALVNTASAAFDFANGEAGVAFRCSRDGGVLAACASPITFAALAEGGHTFSVHAVDAAGNVSGPASRSWTVDTVAPTTRITSPVGSEVSVTNPTFGFAASEPSSTMTCSLDGAIATVCTTSTAQTSSGLAGGLHTFTVRATDPAGNTGSAATLSFVVRLPAPVVFSPPVVSPPPVVITPPLVFPPPVVSPPPAVITPPLVITPPGLVRPPTVVVSVPAVAAPSRVITRAPTANTVGASRTNNITVRFSKAVTGVSRLSFTLRTRAGKAVAAVVTYNRTSRVATLNPIRTLAADTTYVVTLNNRIKIGAGKALAPTRWSFTTGPRPTMTARTPAPGAVGVARRANVTARFGEAVTGVNGASVVLLTPNGKVVTAVVSYNRRTRVVTLNPTRTLAGGATYTVRFTSRIKDAAGNQMTAVRWSFRTGR